MDDRLLAADVGDAALPAASQQGRRVPDERRVRLPVGDAVLLPEPLDLPLDKAVDQGLAAFARTDRLRVQVGERSTRAVPVAAEVTASALAERLVVLVDRSGQVDDHVAQPLDDPPREGESVRREHHVEVDTMGAGEGAEQRAADAVRVFGRAGEEPVENVDGPAVTDEQHDVARLLQDAGSVRRATTLREEPVHGRVETAVEVGKLVREPVGHVADVDRRRQVREGVRNRTTRAPRAG